MWVPDGQERPRQNGHQKWKCAGCGETISASSGHVSASSKLTGAQWVDAVSILIAGAPLHRASGYAGIMAKTISELFRREAGIKAAEITRKAMPVDLFRAYGSYHFGIFGPKKK